MRRYSGVRYSGVAGYAQDASGDPVGETTVDRVDRVEEAWRRERPDIDVSSVGIVSRVWRIGRHLQRQRKERLEALGTDTVTLDVLAMLRRSGPPYRRTAGELMQSAHITSGRGSQRLEKLEKLGYVTRHVSLEDRR
ncbi:MAG: MarR family transcriptional regulator, partial [Actinobacteria bacterium]|nr:MarR family transcriptional regulator [Actinomycetota bacterium]